MKDLLETVGALAEIALSIAVTLLFAKGIIVLWQLIF